MRCMKEIWQPLSTAVSNVLLFPRSLSTHPHGNHSRALVPGQCAVWGSWAGA